MQANQEILVSGGYDNSLRFWDIQKGISSRYISYQESVRESTLTIASELLEDNQR